jgi:hypothetical protein
VGAARKLWFICVQLHCNFVLMSASLRCVHGNAAVRLTCGSGVSAQSGDSGVESWPTSTPSTHANSPAAELVTATTCV